jgi:hypothetical protein
MKTTFLLLIVMLTGCANARHEIDAKTHAEYAGEKPKVAAEISYKMRL